MQNDDSSAVLSFRQQRVPPVNVFPSSLEIEEKATHRRLVGAGCKLPRLSATKVLDGARLFARPDGWKLGGVNPTNGGAGVGF